jgi:hypothetical protein
VKILDFGIAKSPDMSGPRKLTTPGIAMGTPEYMAPEQAAGRPADPRVDIYSVGAILYEMVTGWPPHPGENVMEILTKKATEEPRPARELNPEVPEALEKVIALCLRRDPNARPQSMSALEYELTKSVRGRGQAVAAVLGIKNLGEGDPGSSGLWPRERMMTPHVPLSAVVGGAAHQSGIRTTPKGTPSRPLPEVAPSALLEEDSQDGALTGRHEPVPEPPTPNLKSGRGRLLGVLGGLVFAAGAVALAIRYQPWQKAPAPVASSSQQTKRGEKGDVAPLPLGEPSQPVPEPAPTKKEDVPALLEWARRAADGGRLVKPAGDNMKELLDRIEAADPGNEDAKALREKVQGAIKTRANQELKKKKLDEAEADFRALLALTPEDASVRQKLAATLAIRSRIMAAHNKLAGAVADASAAVELLPGDPSVRMTLADAYFVAMRREQAADEYKKVLEVQPKNKKAQKMLELALKPMKGKKGKKGGK